MTTAQQQGTVNVLWILLGIPLIALRAYVITRLWEWFAVPVFGVPTLTILQAYGLFLIINAVVAKWSEDPKLTDEEKVERDFHKLIFAIMFPFVMWGLARWSSG